jgi:hypothetical protein
MDNIGKYWILNDRYISFINEVYNKDTLEFQEFTFNNMISIYEILVV